MKALVATVNYLLLVDLRSGKVDVIESHRPEYYGISWWEGSDSLVLSHSGVANDSLLDVESYINSEKGYFSFGKTHSQCFLSQPHQILCAPNQWIIATNTGRNCITLYNPSSGFYKDIRINNIHWDRLGKDNPCGEHFNSVFLKNDYLYVLAHRFKRCSQVLKFSYPDCVLLETYEIKQRSGLHNVWVDDAGNIIACHSDAGELIEVKTNETIWASGSSYYSRGLAATADVIVVGDSQIATRENRKTLPSDLWIVDRKTLNALDYLPLGPYGAIHEVRILDVEDEAHHSKIFDGLNHLEDAILERQNVLAEHRKEKLKHSQKWQNDRQLLQQFHCILNGWTVNDGWIAPKNEGFTLALAKQIPTKNFTASFDYSFPHSSALSNQHISLVVGYRGEDDTNMLAILINYSIDNEVAVVTLWANVNGHWDAREVLFATAPKDGRLSVTQIDNKLTITCNNLSPVIKRFSPEELRGAVGIRCLGSQFKNFLVTNPTKTTGQNIKEYIKKFINI